MSGFKGDIQNLQKALRVIGPLAKLEITPGGVVLRGEEGCFLGVLNGIDSVAHELEESVDRFFEEPRPRIY